MGKKKKKASARKRARGAGEPAELDVLAVPMPDGLVMLGVLCAFSYKPERIHDFVAAIEKLDAFNAEHGTHAAIARDEVLTHAIRHGPLEDMRRMRFSPMMVRGILAHEAPDAPLGDEVVWRREDAPDIALPTGRHRGERNVALWLPDPCGADVRREAERITFDVPDDRLIAVPGFRAETGLYRMEPHTRLPYGDPLPEDGSVTTLTTGMGESFAYHFADDGRLELGPPPQMPDELRFFQANEPGPCVGPLVRGTIGNDPAVGVANGVTWSVTAFIELSSEDVLKFSPRSLNHREFSLNDLLLA